MGVQVREICLYLHTVYINTDQKSFTLVQQTIATLAELGMGDLTNQIVLFDAKGKWGVRSDGGSIGLTRDGSTPPGLVAGVCAQSSMSSTL